MLKDALNFEYYPEIKKIQKKLDILIKKWIKIPMLAKTHGQPATPTTLGKELKVFKIRVKEQLNVLKKIPHCGKFGGATGNMNAHFVAFPNTNWHEFAKEFLNEIGLNRSYPTTQIEHYDNLAAQMECLKRINTILIDLARLPTMITPILYAFSYPKRTYYKKDAFSLADLKSLTFFEPNTSKFPHLNLAKESIKVGGNAPCVLNAANEVAVEAFLNKRIHFLDMIKIVEKSLENFNFVENPALEDYYKTDKSTRMQAN